MDEIWDICWSSSMSRFYLVTDKEVFSFDQNTMVINKCPITADVEWSRVACTDAGLFLLTQGLAPSIYEYKLPPSNKSGKEHHSPETCEQREYIFDLKGNHKTLAFVIYNTDTMLTRLELRSSINFHRQWSVEVGKGFRCALLYGDQWMVADPLNRRLFHIANDGKPLKSDKYLYQPWNIIQWGKYLIGIRTSEGINLH